jgi:PhzF family phenazine biosynthesis protein
MIASRRPEVLRYAAFTEDPRGGNPAGVVLDALGLNDTTMLGTAAGVGYSETAFVTARDVGEGELDVRYFSPEAEVPFCGHATIATAVAWAERHGPGLLHMHTPVGLVEVETTDAPTGLTATLTSVPPKVAPIAPQELAELLAALRWRADELEPMLPPRIAYAGVYHPVIAAATRERLAELDYDFDQLRALMARCGWTTVQLIWRESSDTYHARDPFPPGGVVEDPATGAAAAAFGGYLRELDLVAPPARITIHQGHDLGRASLLTVEIPPGAATGIRVSGRAVPICLTTR